MDYVFINHLRVETVIGVYEWEKRLKQPLFIDLEIGCDIVRAAATDSLADAVDYARLTSAIVDFGTTQHFNLIETFAERLAAFILAEFQVQKIKLIIKKPGALLKVGEVGVCIERGI